MKTLNKTLATLFTGAVLTAGISTGAQAVVGYDQAMTYEPYVGVKIGQYDPDNAKDEAFSYGAYGGVKFTPNFGVEAEYLTTTEEDGANDALVRSEYQGEVYGIYATADYYIPNMNGLYAKGRLGYAKNELEVKDTAKVSDVVSREFTADDSGIAGGLGLGYDISPNAAIELAYEWYPTIDTDDVDLDTNGITLGAKFKF